MTEDRGNIDIKSGDACSGERASLGIVIFIISMVTLAGIGQLLIKHGITTFIGPDGEFPNTLWGFIKLCFYWPVFIGLVIYFLFGVSWLKILADVPVSFAFPFLSIGYIVIILGSYWFLNEDISVLKLVSIGLIIAGVICLSRSDTAEVKNS